MFALGFRYHHTGPVSGFFALRESLAVIAEKVGDNFTTCCRYFTERHLQLLSNNSIIYIDICENLLNTTGT